MSCVAVGVGAAGITGALISAHGASSAANTQASAANAASQIQYQEWQQQQANQQPFLQAGQGAIGQMASMAANPQNFTLADVGTNMDPSYAFELQQGQQALQRSAAASGGLQSGGTMKAMAQYTQNMASTGYQQAYQNFNTNQQNQFNRLASVTGAGQTSAGSLMQGGGQYAGQVGSNMMGAANATGAAQIAGANALGGGLSSVASGVGNNIQQQGQLSTMNNWLNSMSPGYGAAGSGSSGMTMPTMGSQFSSAPSAPSLLADT